MAEVVSDDILEQILVRLDLEDIIRCKSVCKSWYSLIFSSGFVNSHLKHNNTIGRRRIVVDGYRKVLFGSSNGLVCILTSDDKLCVVNPCTRELKTLKNLYFLYYRYRKLPCNYGFGYDSSSDDYHRKSYLYGFGYDSSSDDYKVIVGEHKEKLTCFYLLSLKSNVWKFAGKVRYIHGSRSGILCNGALHWLIRDQNNNTVIFSFDLSKEEFKEIPTPADERYQYTHKNRLGIIEECLCIFDNYERDHPKWVMKNYNDNQSWELLPHLLQWDDDVTHHLKILMLKSYDRTENFFYRDQCLVETLEYISAPIFVQSLVSPMLI